MESAATDVAVRLAEQRSHQDRLDRARTPRWMTLLPAIGFTVAGAGLLASLGSMRSGGRVGALEAVLAFFTFMFGSALIVRLTSRFTARPRVVPYFARELAPHGGPSSSAFGRGRSIYLELPRLDALARERGVAPLSSFGFADDYYEQPVAWHSAAQGRRTVEALRRGLEGAPLQYPDLPDDLAALSGVLQIAAARNVAFGLVLRLHERESIQAVATMQPRQGRFW